MCVGSTLHIEINLLHTIANYSVGLRVKVVTIWFNAGQAGSCTVIGVGVVIVTQLVENLVDLKSDYLIGNKVFIRQHGTAAVPMRRRQ